ncbi:dynactin Arp1 p62 subunit RO2 [Poronia punctata]|nr:dynactin Arp1 p62 subunit RO2 [Poronia punctata]
MASFTPYTYIQCPCHESSRSTSVGDDGGKSSRTSRDLNAEEEDDGHAFDPRAPRSNFSLYPLEYLFYCEDCHQIRCPRCVSEELSTIYCPSCLFEVGSSSLKTEGNRCTRSCFQCPICIGPLITQALEPEPSTAENPVPSATSSSSSGSWVLTCTYCYWNSSEIGVKFEKPQGIFAQLQKIRYGEQPKHLDVSSEYDESDSAGEAGGGNHNHNTTEKQQHSPESDKARFAALKSFYGSQAAATNPNSAGAGLSGLGDYGLNSPGALARIMSIYSGSNNNNNKQRNNKTRVMREAESPREGFRFANLDETNTLKRLQSEGFDGTITLSQSRHQIDEEPATTGKRFTDQLWPIPVLLRTKRSKRCPACRHIISKPESKVGNTRWRIRLVASNSIPSISVKPLLLPTTEGGGGGGGNGVGGGVGLLQPLQPVQFLFTFKNPLFDDVKVTLATPSTTPGRFASRVTVLCPEFMIDANTDTDMYLDDVLKKDGSGSGSGSGIGIGGDKGGVTGGRLRGGTIDHQQQAEPGKVWERGRNWVSVVVEVIPSSLRIEPPPLILRKAGDPEPDLSPLREDEDILEIPMFVRLEWESETAQDQVGTGISSKERDGKEKKELAYWCAIGVGRISQD